MHEPLVHLFLKHWHSSRSRLGTGLLLGWLCLDAACSSPSPGSPSSGGSSGSPSNTGDSFGGGGNTAVVPGLGGSGGLRNGSAGASALPAAGGGSVAGNGASGPPCHPDDNSASLSSDVISDLPSRMDFTVLNAPTSLTFTGNASNGDLHIDFSHPITQTSQFPTGYAIDPLDMDSARLQLVAAAPPFGGLYGAETGKTLYAEVSGDTLTLTFCDVRFYQATELPLPGELRVSARFRVRPR